MDKYTTEDFDESVRMHQEDRYRRLANPEPKEIDYQELLRKMMRIAIDCSEYEILQEGISDDQGLSQQEKEIVLALAKETERQIEADYLKSRPPHVGPPRPKWGQEWICENECSQEQIDSAYAKSLIQSMTWYLVPKPYPAIAQAQSDAPTAVKWIVASNLSEQQIKNALGQYNGTYAIKLHDLTDEQKELP